MHPPAVGLSGLASPTPTALSAMDYPPTTEQAQPKTEQEAFDEYDSMKHQYPWLSPITPTTSGDNDKSPSSASEFLRKRGDGMNYMRRSNTSKTGSSFAARLIRQGSQGNRGLLSARFSITAGLLIAIIFAIGHHLFLQYLNGRSVAGYSQFWIKNAGNAFANCVAISLAMAASGALVQIVGINLLLIVTPSHFSVISSILTLKILNGWTDMENG